jgi:hypothetical protein
MKKQLVVIGGQFFPWKTPLEEIGHIIFELQIQFEKFEEDKARKKEINDEIERKKQFVAMRENVGF